MSSGRFWTGLGLEASYLSGYARLTAHRAGGIGAIVGFARVRPRRRGGFLPLKSREVTPAFLDGAIQTLKRWNYDIVPIDDVIRRSDAPASGQRFVSLTFDGATRDLMASAYPVLLQHDVPFTVYVPTAFPDGLGEAWWLALEQVIARHDRISLVMDRTERHFAVGASSDKYQLYDFLSAWMRTLQPSDLTAAINDLCSRYGVDLAALSREAAMDWDDLAKLAADPRVTIGSATVNYQALANLKDAAALREMTMGRAVAQTALGRDIRHFAYPFGDRGSYARKHMVMAEEAGFASAVSSRAGIILAGGQSDRYALPRIMCDGRLSLRALLAQLSGISVGG